MKKLIKRICFWVLDRLKTKHEDDRHKSSLQILLEQECVAKGHIWRSKLTKSKRDVADVKTTHRLFCERCGQRYHTHVYDKFNTDENDD